MDTDEHGFKTSEMNNRPHPGPLPQEREKRLPSLIVARVLYYSLASWDEEARRSDSRLESRIAGIGLCLFPLLGGEGQGEGEREHKLLYCLP